MRTSGEVRERLLERLAVSITRPGMMTTSTDLDNYFRILLEDLAFIDEIEDEVEAAVQLIIKDRGLWGSTGTLHRVGELVPRRVAAQVRASIWAEVAFMLGWLAVDPVRVRSPQAFDEAMMNLAGAIDHDLAGRDLHGLIGDPSISNKSWIGVVDEDGRWFHVDLDRWQEPSEARSHGRYVDTEDAMVVALRRPASVFAEGLGLTPFGKTNLP